MLVLFQSDPFCQIQFLESGQLTVEFIDLLLVVLDWLFLDFIFQNHIFDHRSDVLKKISLQNVFPEYFGVGASPDPT